MTTRAPWQGMRTIARFNWPVYLLAALVLAAAVICAILVPVPWLKAAAALAGAGALHFIVVSLGVSHWVYDRSDLYRWNWLVRAAGEVRHGMMVVCHSGFDEASAMLRARFPGSALQMLDHYDDKRMREPSIRRARALFPRPPETTAAPHDRWPVETGSADVVFGILAIHELRSVEERAAWFAEARRCLGTGGRVVLVEHVRDFANFLAFGPGFLHFHSVVSWRSSWESAGLRLADGFRITPFVRVFTLTAHE